MNQNVPAYGLWGLALVNAAVFDALAGTGPYAVVSHPQYDAFVLIMFGFLLQWPTLLTLMRQPVQRSARKICMSAFSKEINAMATDPVCRMDVAEKGAKYMIHFEHETLYFCSEECRESYARQSGMKEPAGKKGVIGRFLEKIAKASQDSYGGKPPRCH